MTHEVEVAYVYGETAQTSSNPAVRLLSEAMVDYWISFAASLTPNDGKGLSSAYSLSSRLPDDIADMSRVRRDNLASIQVRTGGPAAVRHWELRTEHHESDVCDHP